VARLIDRSFATAMGQNLTDRTREKLAGGDIHGRLKLAVACIYPLEINFYNRTPHF
jgi:hypothetical protein